MACPQTSPDPPSPRHVSGHRRVVNERSSTSDTSTPASCAYSPRARSTAWRASSSTSVERAVTDAIRILPVVRSVKKSRPSGVKAKATGWKPSTSNTPLEGVGSTDVGVRADVGLTVDAGDSLPPLQERRKSVMAPARSVHVTFPNARCRIVRSYRTLPGNIYLTTERYERMPALVAGDSESESLSTGLQNVLRRHIFHPDENATSSVRWANTDSSCRRGSSYGGGRR